MRIVVLDAGTLGEDLSLEPLEALGEVTVYQSTAPEEVAAHIGDAAVVVLNKNRLGAQNLCDAKHLKLICVTATGYDNIDLAFCRERGIAVCNVVGYSTQCVAQVTVSMALSLITNLCEYTEFVRNGSYSVSGCANRLTPVYHEIAGKTWGIVGFGNIGQAVGNVARALGCKVIVNKRTPIEGWNCVDFDTVCREADILSIHTPLNDSTRNLLDREHIDMLKKNAIVINVARGGIIDEAALADALNNGTIAAAALDVFSVEPLRESPLYDVKDRYRLLASPHNAWSAAEAIDNLIDCIAENIRVWLAKNA